MTHMLCWRSIKILSWSGSLQIEFVPRGTVFNKTLLDILFFPVSIPLNLTKFREISLSFSVSLCWKTELSERHFQTPKSVIFYLFDCKLLFGSLKVLPLDFLTYDTEESGPKYKALSLVFWDWNWDKIFWDSTIVNHIYYARTSSFMPLE